MFSFRSLILPLLLLESGFAFDVKICASCHPQIVKEFSSSLHARSMSDPIFSKIRSYAPKKDSCKECHDPKVKDRDYKGVSCIACHTITSIHKELASNKNVYSEDNKTLFSAQKGQESRFIHYHEVSSLWGLFKKKEGSPYHDIDYRKKIYYNAELCMGCHSHKRNGSGLLLCSTKASKRGGKTCIDCHMPKVSGSATTIRFSDRHRYHGFDGFSGGMRNMGRYVDIRLEKKSGGIGIILRNRAPHKLFTHPLRLLELECRVYRKGELFAKKRFGFMRILGDKSRPTPPWKAKEVLKDTMLDGQEERQIFWRVPIRSGDLVQAVLRVYQLLPKAAKKFGIKSANEPYILKEESLKL